MQGAKALSIFDNGDTPGSSTEGTALQFNNLTRDSEANIGAAAEADFKGHEVYAGDEHTLNIGLYDITTAKLNQLKAWMKNYTLLGVVIAGLRDNVQWYEPTEILVEAPKGFQTGSRNMARVMMSLRGAEYDNVDKNVNLIKAATGTSMVFPIEGVTLTLAATGAAAFDLTLTAKDHAGATLDTITTGFNAERGSVELELPADTWTVEWVLNGATDASLRTDGETDYING